MTDVAITIRRGERLYGPYLVEQIQELLDAGLIVPEDEAWNESGRQWTTLRQILASASSLPSSKDEPAQPTLDDLLGNPPTTDSIPPARELDPAWQDRLANVLMVAGVIAIVLGTLTIALHMRATAKSPPAERSSQAPTPTSADHSNPAGGAERHGTNKQPR